MVSSGKQLWLVGKTLAWEKFLFHIPLSACCFEGNELTLHLWFRQEGRLGTRFLKDEWDSVYQPRTLDRAPYCLRHPERGIFFQSHLFEKPCLVQWNFSELLTPRSACWALWEALFSSLCLPSFQLFVIFFFFYLYTISWWEGGPTEPEVASDSTRNNWHKLKYKRFPFNIRPFIFPSVSPEQIAQGSYGVSTAGDVQSWAGHGPAHAGPVWGTRLDQISARSPEIPPNLTTDCELCSTGAEQMHHFCLQEEDLSATFQIQRKINPVSLGRCLCTGLFKENI